MKILKKFCLALCVLSSGIGTANATFIDGVNLGGGFMWNDSIRPRFESSRRDCPACLCPCQPAWSIHIRAVLRHKVLPAR